MNTPETNEDRKCARCPRELGPNNKNKDKLCGICQNELQGLDSPRHAAWVEAGRKRTVTARCERCPSPKVVKDDLCSECLALRERGRKGAAARFGKKNGHALDAIQAVARDPAMQELRELVRKYGITRLAMKEDGEVLMSRNFTARGSI